MVETSYCLDPGRSGGDEPGLEAIRGLQYKLRALNTRLPSGTSAHTSNQVTKCTWCVSLFAFITGNSSLKSAKKWGDTEIAERGRSVLVMRTRYRSAGLTPHQRRWTDVG